MGSQATVMVYVDAIHLIEKDLDFGRRLAEAIRDRGPRLDGTPVRVSSFQSDAAVVVETHHADTTVVVASGQNHAGVLGVGLGTADTPEGRLSLVRALADEMGFTLAPKAVKPPADPAAARRRKNRADGKTRAKGGS